MRSDYFYHSLSFLFFIYTTIQHSNSSVLFFIDNSNTLYRAVYIKIDTYIKYSYYSSTHTVQYYTVQRYYKTAVVVFRKNTQENDQKLLSNRLHFIRIATRKQQQTTVLVVVQYSSTIISYHKVQNCIYIVCTVQTIIILSIC